jgi:DNA-binding transcriptional LysR family regulator
MNDAHLRALDLRLLHVLDTLLELRSATLAARRLHMTQSGVSHGLARLRRALGDPLFVVTPGGLVPTERALAMQGPLRTALEHVQAAVSPAVPFDAAASREPVRLLTNDFVAQSLLPPLLRALRELAPSRPVRVAALDARTDWLRLEDGSFDMALAYFVQPAEHLHLRPLFQEQYVVLCRNGHPRAGPRGLSLPQYLACEHLAVSPYLGGPLDEALQAVRPGAHRRVGVALPSLNLVPQLLAETDAVATLSARIAAAFANRHGLAVHPLPFAAPPFTVSMAWHPRRHWDPSHRWLRELLVQVAGQL